MLRNMIAVSAVLFLPVLSAFAEGETTPESPAPMKLQSPAFQEGGDIPKKHTV